MHPVLKYIVKSIFWFLCVFTVSLFSFGTYCVKNGVLPISDIALTKFALDGTLLYFSVIMLSSNILEGTFDKQLGKAINGAWLAPPTIVLLLVSFLLFFYLYSQPETTPLYDLLSNQVIFFFTAAFFYNRLES